jgi:thiamine-phosphate pyrophosphorylase
MNKLTLCYVTDRGALFLPPGADRLAALLKRIEQAARAGMDWIQLREKDLDTRSLFDLTTKAIAACSAAGRAETSTRVLVNDRLDVAWAAHASGVHTAENSLPIREVARWRNQVVSKTATKKSYAGLLIGASCHSLEEAVHAAADGADYIFFGPVFATPSKQAFGLPQGLQKLAKVCNAVSIPVMAIGGVTAENAAACIQAGASGIAAIRLFQQTTDLPALLRRIRS